MFFTGCMIPVTGKGTIGFNLKEEYLKKYGFQLGDKVKVEISKNKIVLFKTGNVSE